MKFARHCKDFGFYSERDGVSARAAMTTKTTEGGVA